MPNVLDDSKDLSKQHGVPEVMYYYTMIIVVELWQFTLVINIASIIRTWRSKEDSRRTQSLNTSREIWRHELNEVPVKLNMETR